MGFWTIGAKDLVEIHMVTSPAFYADVGMNLHVYQGTVGYGTANLVILNFSADSFDAGAICGTQITQATVGRYS
jgi:hypothetical protein